LAGNKFFSGSGKMMFCTERPDDSVLGVSKFFSGSGKMMFCTERFGGGRA
jgi:hypothetical protein